MHNSRRNAAIIVLGDIGRSPRMQYHAASLLEDNYNVDIIGYVETKPLDCLLTAQARCKIHELSSVPLTTNLTPKLRLIFKAIWQTLSLLMALLSIRRQHFLLVQNPPGIPTLFVCYLYCMLMRTKLIIDWHNYTYSILALGMPGGEQSTVCRFAKRIEHYFGSRAYANFCVTKAMQQDLQNNWHIRATVLYDRPPEQFQPISMENRHALFMKLSKEYSQFSAQAIDNLIESDVMESTALTEKLANGQVRYKENRIGILVSSTSWTPDEDFSLLLKALQEYENSAIQNPKTYPALLCIITGKGPQKEHYMKQINTLNWQYVSIITPWLEIADYPQVLAAADLGVCLHWSSSGLDLPMKVVDMFGCGLPVCAHNFKCLNELVVHGDNGFVFDNSAQLAEQIKLWFKDFPCNPQVMELQQTFQQYFNKFQELRWRENWIENAKPVFDRLVDDS